MAKGFGFRSNGHETKDLRLRLGGRGAWPFKNLGF